MISRSYLTGVAAAELRRHLTNISAAATPVKYEHDWKYLTYASNGEINERSFSTPPPPPPPPPGPVLYHWLRKDLARVLYP